MTGTFYRKSKICFFVFDITDEDSYEGLTRWFNEIDRAKLNRLTRVLVPTKGDLEDDQVVEVDDIREMADKYDCLYFGITSAKEGEGVQAVFEGAALDFLERHV